MEVAAPMATELLRWIILIPLLGAFLNGIVVRPKSSMVAGGIGIAGSLGAFVVVLMVVHQLGSGVGLDSWFSWIQAGKIAVNFHLEYTPLTSVMLCVITGIGTLIHIYASGYMSHDESPWRFFAYLNLFLASMLVLVLSSSLVGVFLGWEGVGLCSYLLIGFWYKENQNAAAGMKAFVTNRVGDLGFVLALMFLFKYVGTLEIGEIIRAVSNPQIPSFVWVIIAGGLFWASTGKSAQLPLYVWLPDAMAGPTPVSALIHAATMVTSGIFVTARLWPVFANAPAVLNFMLWGGIATALLAALIAVTQRDIKKVLAYSTVSQLGFMFAALGAGSPVAAMFHVVTHACFKALLFLGAGSVIHGMHHEQDMFKMGGLKRHMPMTHLTFLVGTLAIIGFPLTSGFFSKDLILEKVFNASPLAWILLVAAALLTAFYMFRCYALTFLGRERSSESEQAHESPRVMWFPLAVLATCSVLVGFFEVPDILGGIHVFKRWVEGSWYGVVPAAVHPGHVSHAVEWALMGITTAASLSVAYFSTQKFIKVTSSAHDPNAGFFFYLSENKFFVDEAYAYFIIRPIAFAGKGMAWVMDSVVINGGLHLFRDSLKIGSRGLALFHTGNVQTYAWYSTLGAALLLWIVKVVF